MNPTPTPNPIHTALEVLRADRQALIDCHTSGAGIPSDDELALQALAQYDQAIKGLESMLRKLQDLRQYDQAINGPQDLQAHFGTLPIRGVRVDDDTVLISAKGRNAAARRLWHWLRLEKEHRAAEAAAQPAGEPVALYAEPLPRWKLNHARRHPDPDQDGAWEIGFLDDEDDRFSPIITVDTGLYYQSERAEPLAMAILAKLAAPPTAARVPAGEPLAWINEDELPKGYPYDLMFEHSKVDGVRLFPVFGPPAAARVPLTREAVRKIMSENGYDMASPQERSDFINGLRHGEHAHGITGEAAAQEGGAA